MMTFRFLNCFFFYLSYSYFYEQQYFYGHKMQRILMENIMQNTKKNKKSLGNFILKKLRSYFLHDLLFSESWAWANLHSNLWAPPT